MKTICKLMFIQAINLVVEQMPMYYCTIYGDKGDTGERELTHSETHMR